MRTDSLFAGGNGEVDFDVVAAVETGNGVAGGLAVFVFSVDFEIRVGIEAGKMVLALGVGNLSADVVVFLVLKINHSVGDGVLVFIHHYSVNGAQLGAVAVILRVDGGDRSSGKDKNNEDQRYRRRDTSGSQLGPPSTDSSGKWGLDSPLKIRWQQRQEKMPKAKELERTTGQVRFRLPLLRGFPLRLRRIRRRPHPQPRPHHHRRRLRK
jgi:hypothetical protein